MMHGKTKIKLLIFVGNNVAMKWNVEQNKNEELLIFSAFLYLVENNFGNAYVIGGWKGVNTNDLYILIFIALAHYILCIAGNFIDFAYCISNVYAPNNRHTLITL